MARVLRKTRVTKEGKASSDQSMRTRVTKKGEAISDSSRQTRVTKEGEAISDPSRRIRVIFREGEEATSSKKEMTEVVEGMYIFYFYLKKKEKNILLNFIYYL